MWGRKPEHLGKADSAVMAGAHTKPEPRVCAAAERRTWMVKGVSFFLFIVLSSIVSGTDRLIILLQEKPMELKKATLWVAESSGVRLKVEQNLNWTCQQHYFPTECTSCAVVIGSGLCGDQQCSWTYHNTVSYEEKAGFFHSPKLLECPGSHRTVVPHLLNAATLKGSSYYADPKH